MQISNSVANASFVLIIGAILSKVLGFGRELLVAYKFGAGSISDAFILTNAIPSILFVTFATAININYIPYYHRLKTQEEKNRFTSNLMNLCLVSLFIGCLIVCFCSRKVLKIFAAGFPADTEYYAVIMLRIVVFSIIPIILSYLFQAYLQANKMFVSTALYGVVINVVVIAATILATKDTHYILSIGTLVSHFVGLFLILYFVKQKTSFHYEPYINPKDDLIKGIVLLTLPLMLENFASSMSLLVGRNLASFLDKGTISGLSYAGTIGNIASTMIATSIMTSTFPLFSQLIAENRKEEFVLQFIKYASVISYILAPLSLFMMVNALDIVVLIFEHGAFSRSSTIIVRECLVCYTVGVLPMALQTYLIRGFYAMQDTRTPVKIKVFALFLNIALNLATVKFFAHKGIALSTSISYLVAYFLLLNALKHKHDLQSIDEITREALSSLTIAIVPAVLCYGLFRFFLAIDNLLLKIVFEGFIFFGLFMLMLSIFKKSVFKEVLKLVKQCK